MKLVVADVSVLFDLYHLEVVEAFFALDFEIYTTNFVYNEILKQQQIVVFQSFVDSGKLTVMDLDVSELDSVVAFQTIRKLTSIPDKSILWKALKMGSILLTCDGKLRKEAMDHNIEVHGSIWVVSMMQIHGVIADELALDLLLKLKIVNGRLPLDEIDNQIQKIKNV